MTSENVRFEHRIKVFVLPKEWIVNEEYVIVDESPELSEDMLDQRQHNEL
jgi:hypothetical protein